MRRLLYKRRATLGQLLGQALCFCLVWLATASVSASAGDGVVRIRAKNADILFAPGISVHVIDITVDLLPKAPATQVNLDDAGSFIVRANSGCARLTGQQLDALFNQHVLDYEPRSLNNVQFDIEDNRFALTGGARLWHRIPPFWLPFSASGHSALSQDGLIRMHVDRIHTVGVPVAGLLGLMHLRLDNILGIDRPGMQVEADTVIIDSSRILPGPVFDSRPSRMSLTDEGLNVCFGKTDTPALALPAQLATGSRYLWVQADAVDSLGQRIAPARMLVRPEDDDAAFVFQLYDSQPQISRGTLALRRDGILTITLAPNRSALAP